MADESAIVTISGLKNCLGGLWVHDGVELSVASGEILGIIGASGSGKTTLLRCLLMLNKPTAGCIRLFGIDVTQADGEQRRQIQRRWGVLFQKSALFSAMTVLENVMFPLALFTRMPRYWQAKLARLKIQLAGLPQTACDQYPAALSGGMLKRAALARALAMDPELLLLDEPTSGLDPASARNFDQLLLDLRDLLKLTVIMVTHDPLSLTHACDRAAFLGEKKVLACLPVEQLMQQSHPLIHDYFHAEPKKRQGRFEN